MTYFSFSYLQENPSSDSFYDSDNAEAETATVAPAFATTSVTKTAAEARDAYRESIHESSEFEDEDVEEERQVEQVTQVWEGEY